MTRLLAVVGLTIMICASCATTVPSVDYELANPPLDRSGYSAIPGEFYGMNFMEKKPSIGESLHSALSNSVGDSESSLEHDLKLLLDYPPTTELRVVGFTDAHECSALACQELSLRRAKLFHDWLVEHGIPPSRLKAPYGYGSARPIRDNETEAGRAMNRRAYISEKSFP